MSDRPPLTFAGSDVALEARLPCGRVLVRMVTFEGKPTPFTQPVHAHELRGTGWSLAEIKSRIAALPLQGAAPITPTSPGDLREALTPDQETAAPQSRGFLHAHHTAAED